MWVKAGRAGYVTNTVTVFLRALRLAAIRNRWKAPMLIALETYGNIVLGTGAAADDTLVESKRKHPGTARSRVGSGSWTTWPN